MVDDTPAILGGKAVRPEGPPGWPLPDEEVLEALQAAFRDGSWGRYHGGRVALLEKALQDYFQREQVLTCSSGTMAVELGLRGLKVEPGDEVILAGYDYPGNFLNVHALGAKPVLVDLDADNWNLAPEMLKEAVSPRTRAVIVSHLHGGLVPMQEVLFIARDHDFGVLEDAAQVPGAMVQGRKAGTWGDVGILSFGGSKLLSAGRGGALITSRSDLFQRAKTWSQRGNRLWPLSELQAAVLLPQLARLEARNEHRDRNVRLLIASLPNLAGLKPLRNRTEASRPAYYKLGFQYDAQEFGLPRSRLVAALRAEGLALDEGFPALHVGRSPRRYRAAGPLIQAERAHHGMVVLHHPVLLGSPEDIAQIGQALHKIRKHARHLGDSE